MAYLGTKPANQIIDSTLIADGTITTNDIANNAVTPTKLDRSYVPTAGGTMTGGLNTNSGNPLITFEGTSSATVGNAFKAPSNSVRTAAFISSSSGGPASCWWTDHNNVAVGAIDGIAGGGLSFWSHDGSWRQALRVFQGQSLPRMPFMIVCNAFGSRAYPDGTSNVYYDFLRQSGGGVGHNNNINFTFTHPGFYRITTTYRYGQGGDVWTSMRFVNGGTVLGISHGTGQGSGNDPATNVFDYIIRIGDSDINTNLQQQVIRGGSGFTIADTGHGDELVTVVQWVSGL
jgi:hypothetical protein